MISALVRRPVLVSMLTIGASLLGIISYRQLPVELVPYTELPMLVIMLQSTQEADPHYLEQQAVVPLEGAVAALQGIERIESYVDSRRATLLVYYAQSTNPKYAYLELQQRVETVRAGLGEEYVVRVVKLDTEQLTNQFMSLQTRGSGSLDRIRHVIDSKVRAELEAIDGVANVEVYGGRERSVEVVLDDAELSSHGLTRNDVLQRLRQSAGSRRYLGRMMDGRRRLGMHLVADYESLAGLEETVIKTRGPLTLGQVATILDGGAERESIARVNGMETVSISLIRDRETNLIALSHETRRTVARLNRALAVDDVELVIENDTARTIEDNIDDIKVLALVGSALAVLVLWWFLRDSVLVLVVATAIPVSVLVAFNLFYALDLTLNTLSLVGLAIAVGMLLDNSIVVLEAIYRHLERGRCPEEAAAAGVGEVGRAVLAATLTTICVFLPFVFSGNFLVRALGYNVGAAVIATLLVSLLVACVLIPTMACRVRRSIGGARLTRVSQRQRLVQVYTLFVKSCLRYPARTVVTAVVIFFLSLLWCLAVSVNVSQETELDTFSIYARMPGGTTLKSASDQAVAMDKRLAAVEELAERRAEIREDLVRLELELVPEYRDVADRALAIIKQDCLRRLRQGFPRVEFGFDPPQSDARFRGQADGRRGGFGSRALGRLLGIGSATERIVLRGSDLEVLKAVGEDLRFNLERLPVVERTGLGLTPGQPQIELKLDHAALSHFGVTAQGFAAGLAGFQPQSATGVRLRLGDEDVEVVVRSADTAPRRVDDLRTLPIPAGGSGTVPLRQLADLRYGQGYGSITRINQEKEVELTYSFASNVTASRQLLKDARAAVDALAAQVSVPAGVSIEVIHDETDLSEFYFLFAAAIALIYMILASVFESLVTPLAMMMTLPLAATGALWGLILTGNSLMNANALVGMLILIGVVVNNGIILLDYTRLLERRGWGLARALLTAGQVRVRPILITAISTTLGMLPLAMGKTEYVAQIGAPFAIVVIGGLVAGTLFTLVLVPTAYYGIRRALAWLGSLPLGTRLAQALVLGTGWWLLHANLTSVLWQFIHGTVLLAAVPALTYLVQQSLRRTRAHLITANEPIHIEIRNLVKVYDDHARFVRQWRRGQRQQSHRKRDGTALFLSRRKRLEALSWQLSLLGFHLYFTYFYLDSWPYIVALSLITHVAVIAIAQTRSGAGGRWTVRLRGWLYAGLFWLLPVPHLVWYQQSWDDEAWGVVLIIGVLWYAGLLIYHGSRRLYHDGVDVARLTGRFGRARRAFYRLVARTPLLGRRKRPFTALDRVSLEIGSGMFGLVGPNGAGKTTLMRIMCGIFEASRGAVRVNGRDLRAYREELQGLIGYLPQEFGTYESMTARHFLDYQAMLKAKWNADERARVVHEALAAVHLEENADRRIGSFSGGMKQRVGIAQTLLHLPRILVVDEPTAGLDPRERIRFRNLLAELARDRVVIFSTHIIEDVSSSCNQLAVLVHGGVRFCGSPGQMIDAARGCVWQAYLSDTRFQAERSRLRLVHHMREGNMMRVRLLDAEQPLADAEPVTPTLEDAYLWLVEEVA